MYYEKKITGWSFVKFIFLAFIVFITIYPFIYMVAVSLSSNIHVLKNEITFFPKGLTFETYKFVFRDERIFGAYKNTIIYVVLGTFIALVLTSMAAYGLSKKERLVGATFFNIMVLITMFFQGGMIPKYLAVKDLGLINTIWAVVLPPAVSAWNLIIMRTFFTNFPKEIEESGKLDGLNDIGIFLRLVLPTSGAVLSTIGLFYAVGLWNAFMGPFLYLKDQAKYPLQIILRDIILRGASFDNDVVGVGAQDTMVIGDSIKFATIIVSVIPIIAVYPYIQKYFVKGVMIGSVKG